MYPGFPSLPSTEQRYLDDPASTSHVSYVVLYQRDTAFLVVVS